jgi:Ca2+-binding RTX toxin-like protein
MLRTFRMSALAILTALTLCVAAHGATSAVIRGTAQSDDIQGTPGGDRIYGLAGNDEIDGRGGSDVIFGGPGNDTLSGGGGKDYLSGEEGNDTLSTGYVQDRPIDFLSCGAGDDLVILADVPEADRGGVRRLLDGAPSHCESVRFTK